MKVYFHKFYTEAHRRWRRGAAFANALEAEDIEMSMVLDSSCQVAMCGAFSLADEFHELVNRHTEFLREQMKPRIRVAHLCWDLYPIHVEGTRTGMTGSEWMLWDRYRLNLMRANLVMAPTISAARRMSQYLPRKRINVCTPACDPWWETYQGPTGGEHVLDVMRRYDDWGCGKVAAACGRLGLPCLESAGGLSHEDFQRAVAQARVLVCAYDEASTGGLTLLEGHALGKRVVASDSEWNGASCLFKDRAAYFRHGDEADLDRAIKEAWEAASVDREGSAAWVRQEFSDAAMAKQLSAMLKGMT